jgi:Ca-activated chloride channel family protein
MRWESPFFFLLVPLLFFLLFWKKEKKPFSVTFPIAFESVLDTSYRLRWLKYLQGFSLFCLVLALCRPQSHFKQVQRSIHGVDIVVLLDVSASMSIEDLADRSRIEVAKSTIQTFIQQRKNDRIGFVIFSGEPLSLVPPTLDDGLLLHWLQQAKIGLLKDGTAIGDGLTVALNHLRSSRVKSRVIVLLTDGDNNLGQIDPATAGDLAAGYGVKVYTIAIGREGRVKMPVRQRDVLGNTVLSYHWIENALNPEILKKIAQVTGGKFYRVADENTLHSVFQEIDQLEKSDMEVKEKIHYEEQFPWFLKLALISILGGQFLKRWYWRFLV